jgi:hypothetical protein
MYPNFYDYNEKIIIKKSMLVTIQTTDSPKILYNRKILNPFPFFTFNSLQTDLAPSKIYIRKEKIF